MVEKDSFSDNSERSKRDFKGAGVSTDQVLTEQIISDDNVRSLMNEILALQEEVNGLYLNLKKQNDEIRTDMDEFCQIDDDSYS